VNTKNPLLFPTANLIGAAAALCAVSAPTTASEFASIATGLYRPLFRGEKDPPEVPVKTFQLSVYPVTNGEFLAFVRENPKWRRSRVKALFADRGYLQHWGADLDLGPMAESLSKQPVTFVSWFAAKAFCAWKGARLPTTAEWEFAAAAGYASRDGIREPEFVREITRWYSTPTPPQLSAVGSARPNFYCVHDLHGLVWEWTSDFNSALVTGDARGDSGPGRDLFCGAGALGAKEPGNFAAFMRFGFRSSLKAAYTVHNLGFRCASD
jgi:formylglycine-generating enzyme required for sulfatase activity